MEKMETPMMAEGKLIFDNAVPSYIETASMVAAPVVSTTEQWVAKEIPTPVAESLNDILQCAYEKARTGARSVAYIVVQQFIFDLFCREVMDEIPEKHLANYFDTSDDTYKIGKRLLFVNAFMAPVATFVQCRTGGLLAAEDLGTKIEKTLRSRTLDAYAQRVT